MRCIAIKERSMGGTHPQVQPRKNLPYSCFRALPLQLAALTLLTCFELHGSYVQGQC